MLEDNLTAKCKDLKRLVGSVAWPGRIPTLNEIDVIEGMAKTRPEEAWNHFTLVVRRLKETDDGSGNAVFSAARFDRFMDREQ